MDATWLYEVKVKTVATQGNKTIIEYTIPMNGTRPLEDATILKEFIEQEKVYDFLVGLNFEFDKVKIQIFGKQTIPCFNEVVAILQSEEISPLLHIAKSHPWLWSRLRCLPYKKEIRNCITYYSVQYVTESSSTAIVATIRRYQLLSVTIRPPFSAASPPFCSLVHFLPISTPKNLVGSTAAGRSKNSNYYNRETQLENYRAWSNSVELWFLGQGFHDHLEKEEAEILEENRVPWLKLDYQLCAILWQSVSPELLEILRSFKTCYSFWTNARDVFANDVQCLFDSTQKIVFLQQTNHDMLLQIAKARTAIEELKGLFVCNSVEETTERIDKLLMVLILRSLHPDYEHVRDQILSSEQIPSMNSLVTRLLRVPTITKGDGIAIKNCAMVASRGGHGRLICSHCGKGHLQNRCYDLIGWLDKIANISSSDTPSNRRNDSQLISDEGYQEFLRLKSNNHTQSSASPSVSTACISHSMGVKTVLYIPKCPYNLISLITFYVDFFVVQDWNMGQLIGKGHESRGHYYLCNNPSTFLTKLKLMVPILNKLSILDCESCQLGKHVKSTFPNQVNKRCNFPFSIVHSDNWGPSRVSSFGFNYFVTFTDEYLRCIWVYLMKERSELLPILMSFPKEMENQFGKTIKILRSFFQTKLISVFKRNLTSIHVSSYSSTEWYS
ncbi:hypothetical protein CR513_05362, partial [Mucuna pruriens]